MISKRLILVSIMEWSLLALTGCGSGSADNASATTQPTSSLPATPATRATPRKTTSGDPLVKLSRVEGSTFIEILEVKARKDGMLFYCTAVRGLQMVDARDPKNMKTVAQLRGSLGHSRFARCQHLDFDDKVLYVTNHGDRVQPTPYVTAYDLTKSPPTEITTFTKKGHTFEGVAVQRGKAYVAMHGKGLAVLKLSGGTVSLLGTATGLRGAWGVAVSGNYAYVTETAGALAVVDISNAKAPRFLARVQTGGNATQVVVRDNIAFVAAGAAGVAVVDVSTPTKPTLLTVADTGSAALQVSLSGKHAFVANWNDFRVFDISKPREPRLIATENLTTGKSFSRVLGASAHGNIAFVGEWTGMYAFELHPERLASDIRVSDRSLDFGRLAAGKTKSVQLMIENDGTAPLRVSAVDTSNPAFAVTPTTLTVAPGNIGAVTVRLTATGADPIDAKLTIRSDDPDEATKEVGLAANSARLGVGDQAPEIEMSMLEGGDWKLSAQQGKVVVLAYFATF